MFFQFAPAIQAAIDAGRCVQVFTSAGVPIGMARDPVTGQFVFKAVANLYWYFKVRDEPEEELNGLHSPMT